MNVEDLFIGKSFDRCSEILGIRKNYLNEDPVDGKCRILAGGLGLDVFSPDLDHERPHRIILHEQESVIRLDRKLLRGGTDREKEYQ